MIFRPFGAKKNKKNWIWKMTLADPPPSMEFSIMDFFFEPFPNGFNYKNISPESILDTRLGNAMEDFFMQIFTFSYNLFIFKSTYNIHTIKS